MCPVCGGHPLERGQNFGNARLIIHPQQGIPAGGQQRLPGQRREMRIMVNAQLLAMEFAHMLPAEEIPARTDGRAGFRCQSLRPG